MADHGKVEYATAEGNDYKEHEGTYAFFLDATVLGILHVVSICVALAVGGVLGHWWTMGGIIFLATLAAVIGFGTGSKIPGFIILVLALLALALG